MDFFLGVQLHFTINHYKTYIFYLQTAWQVFLTVIFFSNRSFSLKNGYFTIFFHYTNIFLVSFSHMKVQLHIFTNLIFVL